MNSMFQFSKFGSKMNPLTQFHKKGAKMNQISPLLEFS